MQRLFRGRAYIIVAQSTVLLAQADAKMITIASVGRKFGYASWSEMHVLQFLQ